MFSPIHYHIFDSVRSFHEPIKYITNPFPRLYRPSERTANRTTVAFPNPFSPLHNSSGCQTEQQNSESIPLASQLFRLSEGTAKIKQNKFTNVLFQIHSLCFTAIEAVRRNSKHQPEQISSCLVSTTDSDSKLISKYPIADAKIGRQPISA